LLIMVYITEQVIVNHGELYCASGFEWWCVMLSQWLWIMLWYACESWWVILSQCLWIMVCSAVPVVVSHGGLGCAMRVNHLVLCWASGCELCCSILIIVVASHGAFCWASGVLSWCASGSYSWFIMLGQWLRIIVNYAEPVVMNHDVLCWASGCEPWWVMISQTLWIMLWYDEPVAMNHGMWCWTNGCESWCVMLSQWLWIMVSYAEPVVANHVVLCCASGCES
jgi:hypothetical protein